jgi:hypothetical protein
MAPALVNGAQSAIEPKYYCKVLAFNEILIGLLGAVALGTKASCTAIGEHSSFDLSSIRALTDNSGLPFMYMTPMSA